MKYGNYNAAAEEMVDISSGYGAGAAPMRYAPAQNGGNKNKILIISIVAAIAVALTVAGFCIFSALHQEGDDGKPVAGGNKTFVFADKTTVSGIDISGKTVKEAKALLEQKRTSFIKPFTLTVSINDADAQLDQTKFKYTYNIDEVVGQIEEDAKAGRSTSKQTYTVTASVTDESVADAVDALCEQYNAEPKNARVSSFKPFADDRFTFEEAKKGCKIDGEDLKAQISSALRDGGDSMTVNAKTEQTDAEVSAAFLKQNIVKLGSYETYSTNTENATSNMHVALEACNGSVIEPGEKWSFNDNTGDTNLESLGYKSANVISGGKITQGIGGGICQASSTIYNAAIRSNMTIVARYNHAWPSSYVPVGLDATINYPYLDLVLQNASSYQMFLECKEEGGTLYATFWGWQDPSYDEITVESHEGEYGKDTYKAYATRFFYKNGEMVKKEALPESEYDIYRSSSDDNTETISDNNGGGTVTYTDPPTEAVTVEQTAPPEPSQYEENGWTEESVYTEEPYVEDYSEEYPD